MIKDEHLGVNPHEGLKVANTAIPGPDGELKARVYTPQDKGSAPLPVIVYFHGGGFVIADLDTYDGSAAALARKADAIVVSVEYRHAPEHKLPAAHQDAFAAYKWIVENAQKFGGDGGRVAVAGESAGANLAANVAIMARDAKVKMPVHELLVYPVAGMDMSTPSYTENADAKPLNKAMMEWFVEKASNPNSRTDEKVIDLVHADLKDLPATTVITDQIDPLRSEGQMLADKLKQAGVEVTSRDYDGVTHEFFGTAPIVAKAKEAQDFAAQQLKSAFAVGATGSVDRASPKR